MPKGNGPTAGRCWPLPVGEMTDYWADLNQPVVGKAIALLRRYLGTGSRPLARSRLRDRVCAAAGRDLGLDDAAIFRWETGRNGVSRFYKQLLGMVCQEEMAGWELSRQHSFLVELAALDENRAPPKHDLPGLDWALTECLGWEPAPELPQWGQGLDQPMLDRMAHLIYECSRHAQRGGSRTLLLIVKQHLKRMTLQLRSSLPDSARRRLQGIASQAAVLAGRLAFLREERDQAAAYLSLGAALAREAGEEQIQALSLIFASDLYSSGFLLGALPGVSPVAVSMLNRAADLGSSGWSPITWMLLLWFRAEVHCFLGSDLASNRDLELARRYQADLKPDNQTITDMVIPDVEIPLISSVGPQLLVGTLALCSRQVEPALIAFNEGLARTAGPARGNRLSGLAAAYALGDEVEVSCSLLIETISERVGRWHPTQVRRAEAVRWRYLSRRSTEPAVRELDSQLTAIAMETAGLSD